MLENSSVFMYCSYAKNIQKKKAKELYGEWSSKGDFDVKRLLTLTVG